MRNTYIHSHTNAYSDTHPNLYNYCVNIESCKGVFKFEKKLKKFEKKEESEGMCS